MGTLNRSAIRINLITPLGFGFLIVLSLLTGCAGTREVPSKPLISLEFSKITIREARRFFDAEMYQKTIDLLLPISGKHPTRDLEAEALYLLGKGYFSIAGKDIIPSPDQGLVGFVILSPYTVHLLKEGAHYLLKSGDTAPNGPFAAESYYLSGKIMDHGYLQNFEKAMEIYEWTMKSYPVSDFGKLSRERYEQIKKKFLNIEDSSH